MITINGWLPWITINDQFCSSDVPPDLPVFLQFSILWLSARSQRLTEQHGIATSSGSKTDPQQSASQSDTLPAVKHSDS